MFDPNNSYIDEINNSIAGILSLVGNISLIFATSKVKTYSDTVKRAQLISAIIRIIYSFNVFLGSPTMAYVVEARSVYIVEGGMDSVLFNLGNVVLIAFLTFVIFSCCGPPVQFLQAIHILLNLKGASVSHHIYYSLTFVLAICVTILCYFAYWPNDFDIILSQQYVYNINGKGHSAYLIASLQSYDYNTDLFSWDIISIICTLCIASILILSTIIVIFCFIVIETKIHKEALSPASVNSQKQLNLMLLVQFTLPFLTIHIPFYLTFLVPLVNVSTTQLSIYLPFLYSWCPALNPIIVMIMVKTIRDKILRPRGSSQINSFVHQNRNN